jgi:hypothetical protein
MTAAQSLVTQSRSAKIDVEYWLRMLDTLKTGRANFDTHWGEVARRIWPEADQFRTLRDPGTKRRQEVFSSHASRALRKWVRIIISLAAPKTSQWQQLRPEDEALAKDPTAKEFFEELTRRVFKLRLSPRARFYETLQPALLSFGSFGNGCFFIDETDAGPRYIPVPLSQVWIAIDHLRRVQTVFYEYPMSASAADMKWRKLWGDKPPEKIKQALKTDPWNENLRFVHVVTPRGNVDPDAFDERRMPWRSMHIGLDDRVAIDEGGYFEMPFMFPRDMVEANEIYGRGAGMIVLPEMGTLNAMRKTHLRTGERVAAPPILTHNDEYSLGARRVNLLPDGLNFGALDSSGNPLIRPFETGSKLDLTREMMQDEMEAINDAFSLNLFRLLIEDPRSNVTAFEIAQRMQEKGELIGPAVDSLQSEIFGPETDRLLGIMSRSGGMPEVPPIVQEYGTYRIEHVSPANQLQRAGEVAAIGRTLELITPLAAADPNIYRKFRGGKVIDRVMEIHGGPTEVLVPEDEFQEMLAEQAQAQQAAMMPEQMATGASAAVDGAKALQLLQGGAGGASAA